MVFYRKYRSQTISELDLVSVRTRLTHILQSKELPHAFLFSGPKGLGKTSAARILAKAINCTQKWEVENENLENEMGSGKKRRSHISPQNPASHLERHTSNIEPCNKCNVCVSITNGSNIDVLEIDAASNRGIDEIRTLRERVRFAPSTVLKKVYIIDEVHMLTNEAFNALLKTLEEPPDHVIFILCTTENSKLPVTIRSRVFTVQFEKPTEEEIRSSLERVIAGEKLTVDEDVFKHIVALSEGAFRDAHKILEELSLSAPDHHITLDAVEQIYKTGSIEKNIQEFIHCCEQKNTKRSLEIIQTFSQSGADFKFVTEKIVEVLRLELQCIIEGKKRVFTFQVQEIKELLELFNEAYKDIKTSVLPQLPLELAVIEWTVVRDQNKKENQEVVEVNKEVRSKGEEINTKQEIAVTQTNQPTSGSTVSSDARDFLYQMIDDIKKDNQMLAALLRSCRIGLVDDQRVQITTKSVFHKDKLTDPRTRQTLQESASKLLNKAVDIEIVIAN